MQVGSGTDPGEGAALAGALLDALAGRAALTYATTHHAELKNRAVSKMLLHLIPGCIMMSLFRVGH